MSFAEQAVATLCFPRHTGVLVVGPEGVLAIDLGAVLARETRPDDPALQDAERGPRGAAAVEVAVMWERGEDKSVQRTLLQSSAVPPLIKVNWPEQQQPHQAAEQANKEKVEGRDQTAKAQACGCLRAPRVLQVGVNAAEGAQEGEATWAVVEEVEEGRANVAANAQGTETDAVACRCWLPRPDDARGDVLLLGTRSGALFRLTCCAPGPAPTPPGPVCSSSADAAPPPRPCLATAETTSDEGRGGAAAGTSLRLFGLSLERLRLSGRILPASTMMSLVTQGQAPEQGSRALYIEKEGDILVLSLSSSPPAASDGRARGCVSVASRLVQLGPLVDIAASSAGDPRHQQGLRLHLVTAAAGEGPEGSACLSQVSTCCATTTLALYRPPPGAADDVGGGPTATFCAPSRAFPLPASCSHAHHSLLLLSFLTGTRVLLLQPAQPRRQRSSEPEIPLAHEQNQAPPSKLRRAGSSRAADSGGGGGGDEAGTQLGGMQDVTDELRLEAGETTLACGLIAEGCVAQV